MSKEMIVKMTGDQIKVKGGEYVRDLIRCEECVREKSCPIHNVSGVEWCSIAELKEEE